jgi:hypothetical protein
MRWAGKLVFSVLIMHGRCALWYGGLAPPPHSRSFRRSETLSGRRSPCEKRMLQVKINTLLVPRSVQAPGSCEIAWWYSVCVYGHLFLPARRPSWLLKIRCRRSTTVVGMDASCMASLHQCSHPCHSLKLPKINSIYDAHASPDVLSMSVTVVWCS